MIALDHVSFSFGSLSVLKDVSFSVPAGKSLAIIGPSGSGKSILLKLISGLLEPDSGSVKLESDQISMLFQKNALFDSFDLLHNLLLPLQETKGVGGAQALTKARQLLKSVGLAESEHLYPSEISGGMQKRLGIARALIVDPAIILYDEPTAGLDPITSRSIAELILNLHREKNTALVMVTNDLQRAYQIGDSLAFVNAGQVRLVGTPQEVKDTQDPELKRFIYSSALPTGETS